MHPRDCLVWQCKRVIPAGHTKHNILQQFFRQTFQDSMNKFPKLSECKYELDFLYLYIFESWKTNRTKSLILKRNVMSIISSEKKKLWSQHMACQSPHRNDPGWRERWCQTCPQCWSAAPSEEVSGGWCKPCPPPPPGFSSSSSSPPPGSPRGRRLGNASIV